MENNIWVGKSKAKINKTIAIDPEVWEMVVISQITNFSSFVNELIEDALLNKDVKKKFLIKRLSSLQREAESLGIVLEVELNRNLSENSIKK